MDAGRLIAELQRRRDFRALVAYGIGVFAVLQVVEPIMHALHLSDSVLTYCVVALALGFPVALVLAWAFDVNGRPHRADTTGPAAPLRSRCLARPRSNLLSLVRSRDGWNGKLAERGLSVQRFLRSALAVRQLS